MENAWDLSSRCCVSIDGTEYPRPGVVVGDISKTATASAIVLCWYGLAKVIVSTHPNTESLQRASPIFR